MIAFGLASFCVLALIGPSAQAQITLDFESPHYLVIKAPAIPGREIRVNYLEAYCRPGSTDADWDQHTVIPHRTEVLSLSEDHKTLRLRDTLADGVVVEHLVTAKADEGMWCFINTPGNRHGQSSSPVRISVGTFSVFIASVRSHSEGRSR